MTRDELEASLPDDLPVRDCAQCGALCVSVKAARAFYPSDSKKGVRLPLGLVLVDGVVCGRPYCAKCMSDSRPTGVGGSRDPAGKKDADPGPWYDNALNAGEDSAATGPGTE